MKKLGVVFLVLLVVSAAAQAQAPGAPAPSLGDLARRARADKENAKKVTPTRVFNNESFSKGASAATDSPAKPEPPEETLPKAAAKSESSDSEPDSEKAWRSKFAKLRAQLKSAEMQAEQLKEEMARASPSSATVVHYSYDARYVKSIQAKIDANNRQIEKLRKQLDDLEEELRRKGLPSGWANAT